jgi:hypothetical protein
MLYVQSFTLIKSTYRRNNFVNSCWWNAKPDCTKHSFINWYIHRHMSMEYFRKHGIFQKTPFRSARLTQHYDFFFISPIAMILDLF